LEQTKHAENIFKLVMKEIPNLQALMIILTGSIPLCSTIIQ